MRFNRGFSDLHASMPPKRTTAAAQASLALMEDSHGGFTPHRFHLNDGSPGAGKTTLRRRYLLELCAPPNAACT